MTKPKRRSRNRLTKADRQALTMLDRLVEEDRRIEQHYDLPFRSPRQVATSLQPCAHCHQDIAWLIFGDYAKDAAGLEAYTRLMADAIKQKGLPTYVIAPPAIQPTWIALRSCSRCTLSRKTPVSRPRQSGSN